MVSSRAMVLFCTMVPSFIIDNEIYALYVPFFLALVSSHKEVHEV